MSNVRIDVTWRGLEVGRQVPLHSVTDGSGRIDVPLPMPVGSALALRTTDGLEIPAVVARVHEQSSAGGETAGMVITPALDDASRPWWAARAEESAAAVPEPGTSIPDEEPAVMIVAPADPTARPTMVFNAVKLSDVPAVPASTPAPAAAAPSPATTATPAWRAQTPTPAPAGPRATTAPMGTPVATPVSTAVSTFDAPTLEPFAAPLRPQAAAPAPTPAAAPAPAPAPASVPAPAVPSAPVLPAVDEDAGTTRLMFGAAPPDDVPEDTSRTTVMAAVDVEAIMAEGAAHAADVAGTGNGNGDDGDSSDGSVGGEVVNEVSGEVSGAAGPRGKGKGPRGKRRRGR